MLSLPPSPPVVPSLRAAARPGIVVDTEREAASVRDGSGSLRFDLDLSSGSVVRGIEVRGRATLDATGGAWSGIRTDGRWTTSATLARAPKVSKQGDRLRITGIEFEGGGVRVVEAWTFTAKPRSIQWRIDRRYATGGTLEDTAMPQATFATMSTWTGAVLGTGGVAWGKLLDAPNATYGVHTGSATLWNPAASDALRLTAIDRTANRKALRFTREPDDRFSVAAAVTREERTPKWEKSRFQRGRQDIWTPFTVAAGETVSATFEIEAQDYGAAFGRGDFKGLDTGAITELLNTIGRIGVIDEGLVGSNGWYSGYICLHEPWLARVGTAIDDPNYVRASAAWLDLARVHAVGPDGMVKSRWKYDAADAAPGTYDTATGFYEAQWGRLMDSQTSYVTNVADQFDASGDRAWVVQQKESCERALGYLLKRDMDGDGLVEMENQSTGQNRSSDWLDIVWASHENAFVNAQLYGALRKWARVERHLGDAERAASYLAFAARLKTSFNRPITDGGFWNPERGWYVYWRDVDGSVHGDNLTVHVNLTALGEGLCDDPDRRRALLGGIETRMEAERLLAWPACFESYRPGEGKDDLFPTYENGDVFLAWAEYGVRAYAPTQPQIALKYVRRIVDQYQRDGLAFQRYLRADGRGAGDDILANNCNVITGLYRDIYGIRPRFDRLELDPHLVPELNGTVVKYGWRGRPIEIDLSVDNYAVRHGETAVRSSAPFGVDFGRDAVTYFALDEDSPALAIGTARGAGTTLSVHEWSARKRWTIEAGPKRRTVLHTFPSLLPGVRYEVLDSGKTIATVTAKAPTARIAVAAGAAREFELVER